MSASETDFIYKTLKQIEKLMAINDLTPAEAQVLRENLSGSTGGGVTEDATAALRTLLKRHAGAKKPRRRHNVLGDGPRMGPSGRVGQRRASGGGSSVGGGSSRGGRRSRNGSRESARANDSSLPPIEGEPPAQALDDWSAIALYQDHFYNVKEAAKTTGFGDAKRMHRAQLDQHITLQEKDMKRRAALQEKYAEEQRKQLEGWRQEEQDKAEKRAAKLAAEKKELDRMLALKQARELREQERADAEDRAAVAKAVKDLEDEQKAIQAKKERVAAYNLEVKLRNDEERRTRAVRMAELQAKEQKAVEEHKAIMLKQEQDREARIQAQADRLNKMVPLPSPFAFPAPRLSHATLTTHDPLTHLWRLTLSLFVSDGDRINCDPGDAGQDR